MEGSIEAGAKGFVQRELQFGINGRPVLIGAEHDFRHLNGKFKNIYIPRNAMSCQSKTLLKEM